MNAEKTVQEDILKFKAIQAEYRMAMSLQTKLKASYRAELSKILAKNHKLREAKVHAILDVLKDNEWELFSFSDVNEVSVFRTKVPTELFGSEEFGCEYSIYYGSRLNLSIGYEGRQRVTLYARDFFAGFNLLRGLRGRVKINSPEVRLSVEKALFAMSDMLGTYNIIPKEPSSD